MQGTRRRTGFTLIELVVVITILAILAAFAVPRFVSLEAQSRAAAMQALGGSVRSGAALAHALWLAAGNQPETVTMEGQTIAITNGYPSRATIEDAIAERGGFDYAPGNGTFTKPGVAAAGCSVVYTPPAAANQTPTIEVTTNAC